jgi:uncharacterized protein (DUF362 family)
VSLDDRAVAVCRGRVVAYPRVPPYHPPVRYPELAQLGADTAVDPGNGVYACVREAFALLGLDAKRFGSPDWNPLGGFVRPGDRVLVKPNWVAPGHYLDDSWEQIVTHGAVLRAVLDYVQIALRGEGRIALADGPMLSSDFGAILQRTGVDALREHYAGRRDGVPVLVADLRDTYLETRDHVVLRAHRLPGDPCGSVDVNLGRRSLFYGFRGEGRYYGAEYDTEEVNRHHRGEIQEYRLSGTAMSSDVLIDVPKLKTHQKVGVTLALKGVVGLNCGRNWLPHRTQGTPRQGGDQFADSGWRQRLELALVRGFEKASLRYPGWAPAVYRWAKRIGRWVFGPTHRTVRGGAWHGNDTLWRMVLDINRALMYADARGTVQGRPVRRRFCVVDGIVAGEGMGPVYADAKPCGLVLAGRNPVAVDVVATELMGFDHRKIPMLAHAFDPHDLPLVAFGPDEIAVVSNVLEWSGPLGVLRSARPFAFAPPLGWKGHIERPEAETAAAESHAP